MEIAGSSSSIRLRLLAATLLILPLVLGLTAWGLDRAFANYQLGVQQERMKLQQLLLAKAAEWDGSSWRFEGLDEPRFGLLNSGLYALVLGAAGEVLWHSPSADQIGDLEQPIQRVTRMALEQGLHRMPLGESRFQACSLDVDYYCHASGVAWGSSGPEGRFLIVESQANVMQARDAYRGYLLLLLLALAAMLLLAQTWVIRRGLLPLRRIAVDIGLLEQGRLEKLEGAFPSELEPLTDSVNHLLASEHRRRERVRNTMDRLTHVLKTPLMLLRNSREEEPAFRDLVQEQVTRMLGIVEGELAKARLDGRAADILGKAVAVQPVLERIVSAYSRLPRTGGDLQDNAPDNAQDNTPDDTQGNAPLAIDTTQIAADVAFQGEERDLQDLFGSILENSLKYCRHHIAVAARLESDSESESGRDWLVISVADDGEGIPDGYESEILRRGARADTANAGQGLGLAIVLEIISAYGGSLHTDSSTLGGALFIARLPGVRVEGSP